MADKPIFDSEKGRGFFLKLQEGLQDILRLNQELKSADPQVRKNAQEKLTEAIEQAKVLFEKMKTEKPELLNKMKQMLSNPENFSLEQREASSEMERKFLGVMQTKPISPKAKEHETKAKKKKTGPKKWMKS